MRIHEWIIAARQEVNPVFAIKTPPCLVPDSLWIVESTCENRFRNSRDLALDLTVTRLTFGMSLHPVQEFGEFGFVKFESFRRDSGRMSAEKGSILVLSWKGICSGNKLIPVLHKLPYLVLLVVGNDRIWLLGMLPVYFVRVWGVFEPQKAMYVTATTSLPLVSIPKVFDPQDWAYNMLHEQLYTLVEVRGGDVGIFIQGKPPLSAFSPGIALRDIAL